MDKNTIEAEFLSCAGLCVNDFNYGHKDVLILNCNNKKLLEFISKFNVSIHCIGNFGIDAKNIIFYDRAIDLKQNKFDLIIDLKNNTTEYFLNFFKENSVLIINLDNLESSLDTAINAIKKSNFSIRMPFKLCDNYYLFLSNKIHPLADICLQKIDMLDGLEYYNAKIHEAAFAMPNYLKIAIKSVARN